MENTLSRYIAFDIGAESGRCFVGELRDGILEISEIHRFPTHKYENKGELFWDIVLIYEEIENGICRAVKQFGKCFDGISIDTWGVDYVLLDKNDKLINDPYHYRSTRTNGMMERAFNFLSKEKIYEYTGIQFLQFNTLYQLLSEKLHCPEVLEKTNTFLPIPNYLLFLLSGKKVTEYTIASTTQLSNPVTRSWSNELINKIGFSNKMFPDIVEPGTILGNILPEVAEKVGIDNKVRIITGASHDTAAAVAAIPANENNWAYLSSGTWSLLGVELCKPLINSQTLKYNFTNEGGVFGTTRLLKNISGLWLLQECKRHWENEKLISGYEELIDCATRCQLANSWINPDDSYFLQPGNMPERIIAFLKNTNQEFSNDAGWIVRCILESLVYKYRIVVKEIEELISATISVLHVVGGGIKNELLCQLTADAMEKKVVTGPSEGTIVGNICMQAYAIGKINSHRELREIVRNSFGTKTYFPGNPDYWKENEKKFIQLLSNS